MLCYSPLLFCKFYSPVEIHITEDAQTEQQSFKGAFEELVFEKLCHTMPREELAACTPSQSCLAFSTRDIYVPHLFV